MDLDKKIVSIRGVRVMLDFDLARVYGVSTGALNQQVRRNPSRFPEDFMFRLTRAEAAALVSQIVIPKPGRGGRRLTAGEKRASRSQSVILKQGQNFKYLPHAFTEHGVAMLSSVLHSERAVQANIVIIREFVRLRHALTAGQPEDGRLIVTVINDLRGLAKPRPRRKRRRKAQVLEVTARVTKR